MKKSVTLFILLICCCISSCKKEPMSETEQSIRKYGVDESGASNIKMMRRLAFGKCVAFALKNESFRNYISRHSIVPGESHFKEIIFNLHKDSLVFENSTLIQILERVIDDEIKEAVGENFIQEIIESDPCIAIKIPDIFYNLQWNIDNVIPHVYVNTSIKLRNGEGFLGGMLSYHYSGKSDYIESYAREYQWIRHFYISVKYSEDYMLLNKVNNRNESGHSLFKIIPQLENCWNEVEDEVYSIGIESSMPGWFFIPKFLTFKVWSERCGFKGPYIRDNPECLILPCHRDCIDNGGNFILHKLKPLEQVLINWFSVYDETFNMGFYYTAQNASNFSPNYCVVPAWRKSNISCDNIRKMEINLQDYTYNCQSYTSPEVIIEENWGKCNTPESIEINYLATNKFPVDFNLLEFIVIYNQNDASKMHNISPFEHFDVYASDLYSSYQVNVPYCLNNLTNFNYSSHELFYKY